MKLARRFAFVFTAFLTLGLANAPQISSEWLLDQVKLLTTREMAGRASGTPGAERAARHIGRVFEEAGLLPGGDSGQFSQSFEIGVGKTASNVVGILPGSDPRLRDEAVVIGAHYDHLGHGEKALDPGDIGVIHPGADDNASGTAAVMALARAFAESGGARRTLVFVAFAGEEIGLLGSSHYAKAPPVPIERTVAMLNLDMVGRMRGNRLHIIGVDSAKEWRALLEEDGNALGLELRLTAATWDLSDHTAFYKRDRPVLFFYTGSHQDYHKPTDTWEKINAEGLRRVTLFAYRVVSRLANQADQLTFVQAPPGPERRGGPYLGIAPDYSEPPVTGVRVRGVQAGSPAAKVGLKEGDIVMKFAGVAISSLEDLMSLIRRRRPGDSVELLYLRDGFERRTDATLEPRP